MPTPSVQQAVNNAVSTAANTQLQIGVQIGHGLVMDRLREVDAVRQQGEIDLLRDQLTRAAPMPSSSGDSPETLYQMARQKAIFEQTLAAKDALLLEWMHSNESFKRLAKKYGKKLELSDEERQQDFDHEVLDVVEEDPKFANTKLAQKKRQQLKSS